MIFAIYNWFVINKVLKIYQYIILSTFYDFYEQITYEKNNPKLEGALVDTPLTKSQMGYVVKKGEIHLLNTVNFILDELEVRGDIERLKAEYLK